MSSVKTSPVPVKYQLTSLEDLFTKQYMEVLLNIDYRTIRERIQANKMNYCKDLKEKGQVASCTALLAGLVLKGTRLIHHYSMIRAGLTTCQERCAESEKCIAITKCTQCTESFSKSACYLYSANPQPGGKQDSGWETTIFRPKISKTLKLGQTIISGSNRNEKTESADSIDVCKQWCIQDEQCIAFSFCGRGCTKTQNCALFGENGITGFKTEATTDSVIFGLRFRMTNASLH